jgi:tRNA/tmRNA/rRNA uracil-C5-methylase (TrmA/RlmC/RlmD family)
MAALLVLSRLFSSSSLPPVLSEAQGFFASRGLQLRCEYVASAGSRTTSRIAVRSGPKGGALIGMFRPGTHEVVPCLSDEECHVPHHPAINEVIAAVSSELACLGELSAYDEATHSGTLRYLQLSVERSTRLVQLVLVANARRLDEDAALGKLAARLWSRHGEAASPRSLHSIWVNLNPTSTNNILSYEAGSWQLLHHAGGTGEAAVAAAEVEDEEERAVVQLPPSCLIERRVPPGCLIERYASVAHDFVLPPFVFRQANLEGFDGVVRALCAAVPPGARVVEWYEGDGSIRLAHNSCMQVLTTAPSPPHRYAGVGSLGLAVVPTAEWVRCSDVNPPERAFEASRQLLPPAVRPRITYAVGTASERLCDASGADVAIVDPPRKGLDPLVLSALCDQTDGSACASITVLIYISCGFAALARELDALLAAGWRVRGRQASAHVLFTNANHIETMVIFDRVRPSRGAATTVEAKAAPAAARVQAESRTPALTRRRRERDPDLVRDPQTPRARRLAARRRKPRADLSPAAPPGA